MIIEGKRALDRFLEECPHISQDERESIMEFVGGL